MAREFKWNQSDRWISNRGHGPLVARILAVAGGTVTMERKIKGGRRWTRFELPLSYLLSGRCGWQRESGDGA